MTDRETERQTDRQTNREIDRQVELIYLTLAKPEFYHDFEN